MILSLIIMMLAFAVMYYSLGVYNEVYWRKRGVKFHNGNKVLGPMGEFMTTNKSLFEIFNDIYKRHPEEPAVGVGTLLTPGLYVKHPVNVQRVLQSDFSSFNHKGVETHEGDHLADNVLFMFGDRWKLMRQSMGPLFSSGKLKNMFPVMDASAQDFVELLNNDPRRLKENALNTLCTFSCAAVGGSIFGVGTDSMFDSPFLEMALKALKPTAARNFKFAINFLDTNLFKLLRLKLFKEHEKFFIPAVKEVLRRREEENVRRHDFADRCIELKSKGLLKDHNSGLELEPTDQLLAAQAFFFFIAGVEPVGVAMFSTLVELGRNPESLRLIHEEIDRTFEKYNNRMSYESIQEMEYVDMVYKEAMRMYPPIGFLTRECTRDTVLPVGNIRVDKGTKIFTPIYEIHRDPRHFPRPDAFDPERFSRGNRSNIPNYTFMPFGSGRRICIGSKYAALLLKTGLVRILRNFTVKTVVHEGGIKYSKQNIQVRASNLDIELIRRNLTKI